MASYIGPEPLPWPFRDRRKDRPVGPEPLPYGYRLPDGDPRLPPTRPTPPVTPDFNPFLGRNYEGMGGGDTGGSAALMMPTAFGVGRNFAGMGLPPRGGPQQPVRQPEQRSSLIDLFMPGDRR